ncbi:MAG TPA: uracil-DNA glycosylase [Bryobacteraceae bacterium]|nr:uracil-DNA glycosylase [Bryobacteraceae bacterium]
MNPLEILNQQIVACVRCPRLVAYRAEVGRVKRRAYRDWDYWAKPVPGFGDPRARLLLIGLAPGAHGANRTGRMFTGDSSGDFLYKVLHAAGFASQPTSTSRDDGLTLIDAYISAVARCAPPDNKPALDEIRNCRPYLERDLELLERLRVVVALGRLAFDAYLGILQDQGKIARRSAFSFAHNAAHETGPGQPLLISSYHPSQQNTSTGKLTEAMFRAVFQRARRRINSAASERG